MTGRHARLAARGQGGAAGGGARLGDEFFQGERQRLVGHAAGEHGAGFGVPGRVHDLGGEGGGREEGRGVSPCAPTPPHLDPPPSPHPALTAARHSTSAYGAMEASARTRATGSAGSNRAQSTQAMTRPAGVVAPSSKSMIAEGEGENGGREAAGEVCRAARHVLPILSPHRARARASGDARRPRPSASTGRAASAARGGARLSVRATTRAPPASGQRAAP